MVPGNGSSWQRWLVIQFTCIRAWKNTGLPSNSIHQATETISVIAAVTFLEEIVSGDSWFETRSQIWSAGTQVNVRSDELLTNLLELRAKRTLASITYIGTLDRGFVPTLRDAYFKTVDPLRVKVLLLLWQYRVIHKSLRSFRTRLRNNQDRHSRKQHTNK